MTTCARIARLIDHTLLKPEATTAQVNALIAEAADLNTYSVCVSPSLLPVDVPDDLHVATVCGFPSGAHATAVKAAEAADALAKGAEEIDMVVNHTSDAHPWFQASRSGPEGPYGDFYVWADDDSGYDDARIIFVDTEESNWAYDVERGQFYWHRFFSHQPDLNYRNPAAIEAIHARIPFLVCARRGAPGGRPILCLGT